MCGAGPGCADASAAAKRRPPKPAATQAPAKDPDFEARQFAGRVLQLAIKQHKAREREFARSEKRVAAAVEKNDDMGAKIDRLQRKKPRDAEKELKLLLKAEQYINKELMLHAQAMYAASFAESTMLKCQIEVKDLPIHTHGGGVPATTYPAASAPQTSSGNVSRDDALESVGSEHTIVISAMSSVR